VTDELLSRFAAASRRAADRGAGGRPDRRRTGGALLGDRIRMNSLRNERIFMRSMATPPRNSLDQRDAAPTRSRSCARRFDLVIVETAGIGQSDSEIVDLVDLPVYVMTSEFGAASQLEKIDMLDLAEIVVINKFDKRGALGRAA
jgi:methylmalonyl-CoA mutase